MNKILDLAKTFQETSKKELENTNEIVENAIKLHERNLLEQLETANENLAESIQIEQKKLIKSIIRMYRLPSILALSLLLITSVISALLTVLAHDRYQEMKEWQKSAEIAQKQSGGIRLTNCSIGQGQTKPCVEMDENYLNQHWGGDDRNLMILKIYDQKGK